MLEAIKNSSLFDEAWYKDRYAVIGEGALHYLEEGWKLGFDPSTEFSTEDYLLYYPDVAAAGINPLGHFLLYGQKEGRTYKFPAQVIEDLRAAVVPQAVYLSHDKWPKYLGDNFNRPGLKVLEVGSRAVTGEGIKKYFPLVDYTGFDIYPGPNVDVVGDAHRLSSYFKEGEKFDLIYSSAVFEHLAMPWICANEIIKLLKVGGYVFIETHYSYTAHERPWHFFQFSDQALKVLFSPAHGIECQEAGVSNPIEGRFAEGSCERLLGQPITNMYCHSEFFGKKVKEIEDFSYENIDLSEVVGNTHYPKPRIII